MSNFDVLVLASDKSGIANGEPYTFETPYGAVHARLCQLGALRAAWIAPGASPFAAIYAAKTAGATRVVELAQVAAHNRLLAPGDLLLPDDLVDRTQLARYTFFASKGYGFLAQREPFCPLLRGALLAAASAHVGHDSDQRSLRVFARGVYLATTEQSVSEPEPFWDADVVGGGVVPTSFLARELELCYAPLCLVTETATSTPGRAPIAAGAGSRLLLADLIADALGRMPAERACVCATAMQQYRERGDIGADWQTWIAA